MSGRLTLEQRQRRDARKAIRYWRDELGDAGLVRLRASAGDAFVDYAFKVAGWSK